MVHMKVQMLDQLKENMLVEMMVARMVNTWARMRVQLTVEL